MQQFLYDADKVIGTQVHMDEFKWVINLIFVKYNMSETVLVFDAPEKNKYSLLVNIFSNKLQYHLMYESNVIVGTQHNKNLKKILQQLFEEGRKHLYYAFRCDSIAV